MCVYSFDYNERTGVSRRINNESKVFMIKIVLESFTTIWDVWSKMGFKVIL